MKHFLITEWNVDMIDMDWLTERQKLFERITLPSVMAQTEEDFEWILVSDSRTPDEFKKVLESYPATVFYHNWGSHDWESPEWAGSGTKGKVMQRSIDLEYISKPLREFIGEQDTDYVITSRLDNDDGISTDHIAKIQRHARHYWKVNPNTRFWLNLVRGLKYCDGHVYPVNSAASPFISFVEPPHDLLTTYQVCHTEARGSQHKLVQVREGQPTWLQVIHGDNLLNKLMRVGGKKPFSAVAERFKIHD
jgi:hypothetical protein